MKKLLVTCIVLVFALCGLGAAAYIYAPTIGLRLLGQAIGGTVQASRVGWGYSEGFVLIAVDGVVLKGSVEGSIAKWHLRINPWKGFRIAYVGLTDFDLSVKDSQGKVDLVPIPVELAELKDGVLRYKGQTYRVRLLTVKNLNTDGEIEFELDGSVDGIGNFKSKGKGFLRGKRSKIEGELSYSQLDLSKILKSYEGFLRGTGTFSLREGKLNTRVSVEASGFVMREKFLKEPLRIQQTRARAQVVVMLERLKADIHLDNLFFNDVPVDLKLAVTAKTLVRLELRTGFLAVSDVKRYIDLSPFAERGSDILGLLKHGRLMVRKLTFAEPKHLLGEFHITDVSLARNGIEMHEVSGSVTLTDDALLVSNAKGALQRSTFYDVTGRVPFDADKEITGKGKFSADVRDVSAFLELDDLKFTGGTTEGEAEIRGIERDGFAVSGTGMVKEADIVWKNVAMKASGRYRFNNSEAVLEPLMLAKGESRVTLNGSLRKDVVRLSIDGAIGTSDLRAFLSIPYRLDGLVLAKGDIVRERELFSARGELSLREFSLDVPGIVSKRKGMDGIITGSVRWDGTSARFEKLTCRFADAVLQAGGQVFRDGMRDLEAELNAPNLESLSNVFLSQKIRALGSAKLRISAREIRFPIREIPEVVGALKLHRGVVQLPFLAKPLTEIELSADLKGGKSTVNLTNLRIGNSRLRNAVLSLDRTGSPNFSVIIDMENLEPADFAGPEETTFRIPVVDAESLLARLSGDLNMRVQRMVQNDLVVKNVEMAGAFTERSLVVQKLTGELLDGTLACQGRVDLSGHVPVLQISGEAREVKGGMLIRLFDPESNVLVATGRVSGNLRSTGRYLGELLEGLEGTIAVESRNGVIRKWNLLSKILALLNIYESFRGKVDLGQEGMPYRVIALTLRGEKGVFSTDDFTLNSPSMVIVGQGSINIPQGTLDGTLIVSPLVALNRTIDYIPILRSIFKRKEGGFVYVAYDVKGPIRDPQLSTSYVQTVGKRLLDILKNIIMLPVGVFEK